MRIIIHNDHEKELEVEELSATISKPIPGFFRVAAKALLINLLIVMVSIPINFSYFKNLVTSNITVSYEKNPAHPFMITKELEKIIKINDASARIELKRPLTLSEKSQLLAVNTSADGIEKYYDKEINNLYSRSHPFGDIEVNPESFWWIMLIAYLVFTAVAFRCYSIIKRDYLDGRIPDAPALEEIEGSYNNLIDIIGFSTPLFGAAILLLSVLIGTSLFVNVSVPFEIKAILVLVLSKAFTIVIDKVTDEFRVRIYAQAQLLELQDQIASAEEKKKEDERRGKEAEQFLLLRNAVLASINFDSQMLERFEDAIRNNAIYSKQIRENIEQIHELSKELEKFGKIVEDFQEITTDFGKENNELVHSLQDPNVRRALELMKDLKKSDK